VFAVRIESTDQPLSLRAGEPGEAVRRSGRRLTVSQDTRGALGHALQPVVGGREEIASDGDVNDQQEPEEYERKDSDVPKGQPKPDRVRRRLAKLGHGPNAEPGYVNAGYAEG